MKSSFFLILPFHLTWGTLKSGTLPIQLCLQAVDNPAGNSRGEDTNSNGWVQMFECKSYILTSALATFLCVSKQQAAWPSFCRDIWNQSLISNRYKLILSQDEKSTNNEEHVTNFNISLSESCCQVYQQLNLCCFGKPTVNKDFQYPTHEKM